MNGPFSMAMLNNHFCRLDPTEAEEAQCDALISLSVDGSRSMATTDFFGE